MGTVDGVQYSLDELKRIFGLNLHRVYYRFLPRMSGASPLTVRIRPSRFGIGYAGTFSWMSPTFTRMPSRQVISTVEIQRLVRGTWKNFRTINAGITNSYTTRDFILFRGQYRYRINSYTSFSPGFPMKSISRFQNFEIR
jgi:hypothetical protein